MSGDIFKHACRVCLKENIEQHNVFEKTSTQKSFALMLTAIADIMILKGDGLPDLICNPCSEVLIKAYKLKVLAEKTNTFLQLKSKQLIINRINPTLLKIKQNNELTIKKEPKGNDIIKLKTKRKTLEADIFADIPKDKKPLLKCDFFTEPVEKKKSVKDDIFFNDANTISENLFENDHRFADNDDFDISYSNKVGSQKSAKKTPVTKKPINFRRALKVNKNAILVKRKIEYKRGPYKKIVKPTKDTSIKKRDTEPRNNVFVCSVCGLVVSNIQQHMNTHKELRYKCPVCPKEFAKKVELQAHTITHSDVVRNYICEVCPLRFFTMKSLKRHKATHAEKKFECDHCQMKFNSRWVLGRHINIHLGIKPFVCDCGVAFASKGQLKQHARSHTGEKNYECLICNVSFSYKCNLNNHVMKHHGVNIRFQTVHKVTEDGLRMLLERAALEGMDIASEVTEEQNDRYSDS